MKDNKFDEMFRSLKDREITPSSNALKELQDALKEADKDEMRKKKPIVIGWVAAAIIVLGIGIKFYSSHTSGFDPISIVEAEVNVEPKETPLVEVVIVEKQVKEVDEVVEELDNKKFNVAEETPRKVKKVPLKSTGIAQNTTENIQDGKVIKSKAELQLVENGSLEESMDLNKRLADLLKPIDDAILDSLIQQERVALAIESIDDKDIMKLLRDAQIKLETQGETRIVYSADSLLEQVETELETNKSFQNILNKAIGVGLAEVQSLFKR